MMKKKRFKLEIKSQSLVFNLLTLILILFLFLLLISVVYYFYDNFPGNPEILNIVIENDIWEKELRLNESISFESLQFYPNMKFNHNRISYKIDFDCELDKRDRVLKAFNEFVKNVDLVSFYESENPDIEITCSKKEVQSFDENVFIAGEGGAKEVIQTGRYNVINNGVIFLYENHHLGSLKCDYPNVELHELMHVFGFDHSSNEMSLMNPYLKDCGQILDDSIIKELNRLYSEINLPDLYFEDAQIIKKGKYLDFNITIKNSGVLDAESIKLTVFDDNELAETREIDKIKYGAGIFMEIKNLKLVHRNPDKIIFVIDVGNEIPEIDEENNRLEILLD